MHSATCGTDPSGEPFFERSLPVLVGEFDLPFALGMGRCQRFETGFNGLAIFGAQQSLLMQHLCMGDRGAGIVGHQALIEGMIFPRGIFEYALIERCTLVPQPRHVSALYSGSEFGRFQFTDIRDHQCARAFIGEYLGQDRIGALVGNDVDSLDATFDGGLDGLGFG